MLSALSGLLPPATPDYAGIARALRGCSCDEVRMLLLSDAMQAGNASIVDALPALWAQTGLTPASIATLAHKAMILEVEASPKPGLVSPDHNGAHRDMDYPLFVISANSLMPYLEQCAALGMEFAREEPEDVFPKLRTAGISAEKTMFAATGGVNTHKGLLFSLGLLCAASGRLLALRQPIWPRTVAEGGAAIVRGIVGRDLGPLRLSLPKRPLTAGERLFVEHGIGGIRQEAEEGFPSALAAFERLYYLYDDLPRSRAIPQTLLWLMSATADTNILSRGGLEALAFIRETASDILAKGGMYTSSGEQATLELREACVEQNLSPGGSADLLALALFFRMLQDAE